MIKSIPIYALILYLLLTSLNAPFIHPFSEETRILDVAKKMQTAFQEVEDYTCEVEQIFYQEGIENQRYLFKYYFKRKKRIRVDFNSPYPTLSLFYNGGEEKVTAVLLRSLGLLKFRLSINNPMIQTVTGQKINQTDIDYFIQFLFKNLERVPQRENEFEEKWDSVRFWFQGLDYIRGKHIERYQIYISKENWLPIRIERYASEGNLIERSIIKNYTINTHLDDRLFIP